MVKDELRSSSNELERVLFIWSIPASGHMNPTLCFANELLQNLDAMKITKIVFYSGKAYKDQILNLPNNINQNRVEFRDYFLTKNYGSENLLKLLMDFDTKPGSLFRVFKLFENSIKLGNKHLFKYLLQGIYREKPVLILYDQALFFSKFALNLYEKRYKCPKPLHICYVTTFLCARGIYPKWSEMGDMGLLGQLDCNTQVKNLLVTIYDLMRYIYRYYKTLWWKNGFTLFELLTKCEIPISLIDESLNLVFVLPEAQPRIDQFHASNIKFVGPCVDETVRSKLSNTKLDMEKYVKIIEKFLMKNSLSKQNNTNSSQKTDTNSIMRSDSNGDNFKKMYKPIIYVSMGTVFNNENKDLFTTLVDACKFYADEYSIIISTGDESTYERYSQSTCEKILFVPHTPQVEILKRADLFITHAGMNSVSEAMQYGVPIICIPLSGDQPFVAWRAEELGIGIRLQADTSLTIEKVKNAISKILTDSSYLQKAYEYADISRQYCGHKSAVEHVVNFISKNELKETTESTYSSMQSLLKKNNQRK